MKKNNGITLIALIITIIILLILAGVTISLTLGENGLFNTAKQASEDYIKAGLKEELEAEITSIRLNKIGQGTEIKRENLIGLSNIGATVESYGIPALGEYKDYMFEVDENYVVTITGKAVGEKPTINGEIVTTGIVAKGGTVEIKVTASVENGKIELIEATNGAELKQDAENSEREKHFIVRENGTYYFRAKVENGRSAVTSVDVRTIIEEPKISIQTITDESFKIVVTNNFEDGIVSEYKYYVEGEEKNSGTINTNYIVEGLDADTEYKNIYVEATINGLSSTSSVTTAKTKQEQIARVNPPVVSETGLVPVTINANGSLNTVAENDANWYAYGRTSTKWANAKTNDNSLWVWIPRYAYKITYTNPSDKSAGGTIDIVFLSGATNKDFNGNDVTDANYVDAKGKVGAYIVHPSFENGDTTGKNNRFANGEWDKEITGFWMAKFEAGYQDASIATNSSAKLTTIYSYYISSTGNYTSNYYGTRAVGNNIKYPVFQANRPSMNYLGISDAYDLCLSLKEENNPYGFTSEVDSHMTKNSEWGAIAYLTHSKYGRNGEEVRINNVSADGTNTIYAVTGYAASQDNASEDTTRTLATLLSDNQTGSWTTSQGQLASSTGNIYGIYDLSGGLWEYTTGYLASGSAYKTYGGSLKGESTKYKSKYDGTSSTDTANYNQSTNKTRLGEAIWETSISGTGSTSWNSDSSSFIYTSSPYILRGGNWDNGDGSGIFKFSREYGGCIFRGGFRPVLIME